VPALLAVDDHTIDVGKNDVGKKIDVKKPRCYAGVFISPKGN
jgi:hypothetical protein